ncbi:MAG: ribosomal protein S18-alanine N-acetyltransferase, partial [Gemmatimonadaceae bacterium]
PCAQRGRSVTSAAANDLVIRHARTRDLDAIAEIERTSFSDPWNARSFEGLLAREEAIFDVAIRLPTGADGSARENDEIIVGFCVGHVVVDEAELTNVAVRPSVRREGVGRRLVDHVINSARNRGARELFLEVRVSNEAARALYLTLGFAEVGRRTRYYDRPVEDALILRLAL